MASYDPNIWQVPYDDWENIDPKIAAFILQEGKDNLKDIWDIYEKTTQRSILVMTILIAGISALMAVWWKLEINKDFDRFFSLIVALGSLAVIALQLIILIPSKIIYGGRVPREIAVKEMLYNRLDNDKKYLAFLLNEIKNVQFKIDQNNTVNKRRLRLLKVSYIALAFFFYITVLWLMARQF